MPFAGVLEDTHLPHVPGTIILNEEFAQSENVTSGLRHAKGRNAHVILAPQPSDDPNDPLNWSSTKKLFILLILGFGTCLMAATISPLLNAGLFAISVEFDVEIGNITLISGYQLLIVGASAPFVSALAIKYGKRPCFFFSSVFGLISTIIGSASHNYNGLLASRIVQGFGVAAYESLIISVIGDLYFVHERGRYTSAIMFLLAGVSNISSVITGYVTNNLGWKWLFHLLIIFIGAQIILVFFFCPETTYIRDKRFETDEVANDDLKALADVEKRHKTQLDGSKEYCGQDFAQLETISTTFSSVPPKKTFWQQTALFTGKYSDENLLQLVIAPFAVCSNVAVLWFVLVSGTVTATYVAQAYVVAQIFSFPPYNLTPSGVGLLFLGPFVGGIIGSLLLGAIFDPIIKWFCAKNKGVYEPEYRLIVIVFGLATGAGLIGWGHMLEIGTDMYACAAVHGIVLFGVIAATLASSTYVLDAYRNMSNEIFIAGMLVKNFLFYGFSYFMND